MAATARRPWVSAPSVRPSTVARKTAESAAVAPLESLRQQWRDRRTNDVAVRNGSGKRFERRYSLSEQDLHPRDGGNGSVRGRIAWVRRGRGVERVEAGRELQIVGKCVPVLSLSA